MSTVEIADRIYAQLQPAGSVNVYKAPAARPTSGNDKVISEAVVDAQVDNLFRDFKLASEGAVALMLGKAVLEGVKEFDSFYQRYPDLNEKLGLLVQRYQIQDSNERLEMGRKAKIIFQEIFQDLFQAKAESSVIELLAETYANRLFEIMKVTAEQQIKDQGIPKIDFSKVG